MLGLGCDNKGNLPRDRYGLVYSGLSGFCSSRPTYDVTSFSTSATLDITLEICQE